MHETDLAYLAGIVDGEGYFKTAKTTRTFGIVVAVTDECLISWLHETFPGSRRHLAGKTTAGNQVYLWWAQQQDLLLQLLRGMLPYLVIKRRQAEAMVALIEHLQAIPRYSVPTSKLSTVGRGGEERARRRDARLAWRDQADLLRIAVRDARH